LHQVTTDPSPQTTVYFPLFYAFLPDLENLNQTGIYNFHYNIHWTYFTMEICKTIHLRRVKNVLIVAGGEWLVKESRALISYSSRFIELG
jgi:hypothetical protein